MSLISELARRSRFDEIDGCPLARPFEENGAESCASCAFNLVAPNRARVGCVISTPAADYDAALARLSKISARDYTELREILDEARTSPENGVRRERLERLLKIARRWWRLVGTDLAERQLVAILVTFAEAALDLGEPVRILT